MSELAQTIVLCGAVVTALAIGLRYLWKGFRIIERLWLLVEHELKPNSGTSLRDKVDETNRMLTTHLSEAAHDRERLAAVEAKLGIR